MPRLNRAGDLWCAGIAGAGFYGGDFDGDQPRLIAELHPAGMRAFLNDEEAVTQVGDREVRAVNCRTSVERTVAAHGAGEVFAGGGVWASFLAGSGVRTSTGLQLPDAYVGAGTGPLRNDCVGPDGSIAIKAQYHSAGPWHVYSPAGTRWLLSPHEAANIQLLGDLRAIYRVGWDWDATGGAPVPRPLFARAWHLKLLELPDGPWLVYQAEDGDHGRILAHPNGDTRGYLLGHARDAFGLDAVQLADGRMRVIWATSEGEHPSSLVTATFRTTDARVSLTTPAPRPNPAPEPKPTPEPTPEPRMYRDIKSYPLVAEAIWNRCTDAQRKQHAFVAEAIARELRDTQMPAYWRDLTGNVFSEPGPGRVAETGWCVNQKRGNQGDSEDAISVPHPHGAGGWAIVDVVAGMNTVPGDPAYPPRPAWQDVTQVTIDHGTVGGGRAPNDVLGGGGSRPGPGPGPVEDPALLPIVQELSAAALQLDIAAVRFDESIAALRALKRAPAPAPHECPTPRWPDDHECPASDPPVTWPPHAEIEAMAESWLARLSSRGTLSLHEAQLVHLLYIYFAEHADGDRIARQIEEWR
jgi:hypothetical protein